MIGVNEFRLNEATMMAAVAEYFNARYSTRAEIEVTSVSEINNPYKAFIVKVKPKEVVPK